MLSITATKNQKIVLGIMVTILILYLVYKFVIASAYQNYSKKKAEERKLKTLNTEYYNKYVRLQQVRRQYLQDEYFLKHAARKLSIDVSNLLNLLTNNSPVNNFTHAIIEKEKKKIEEGGIVQYPFEIEFQSDFQNIGEFLLYQESSLPISFIENIEIKTVLDQSDLLKTQVSGIIYKVK
ncbi:type 4a pilus biogenesis protein PilO [candidate division KSB1 bacterium]|nr:type 4a pilus biogenesis protein PilO [candidate division KSB1 bacterium]